MDANLRTLLDQRDHTLNQIQSTLETWDGTLDLGLAIVEKNGHSFNQLQALDQDLRSYSHPSIYSETYLARLTEILGCQDQLLKNLKREQDSLLDKIKEIKKKDQVLDSYISKDLESLFIDKDL